VKCAACSIVLGHPNCPEEMEEVFVKYENHLIMVHEFAPHCVNTLKVRTKLEVWTRCPIYDAIIAMEENASFTSLEFQSLPSKVIPIPSLPDRNLSAFDIDDPDFTPPPDPAFVQSNQLPSEVRYEDRGEANLQDITREEIVSSEANNENINENLNLEEVIPSREKSNAVDQVTQEIDKQVFGTDDRSESKSITNDNEKLKRKLKRKHRVDAAESPTKKKKLGVMDGSDCDVFKIRHSGSKKTEKSKEETRPRTDSGKKERKVSKHKDERRTSDETSKGKLRVKVKSKTIRSDNPTRSNENVDDISKKSLKESKAVHVRNASILVRSSSQNGNILDVKAQEVEVKKTKKVQFAIDDAKDYVDEESEELPCPWFEFGVHKCRICAQLIYLGFVERHMGLHQLSLDLYMLKYKVDSSLLEIGAYECQICEDKVVHTVEAISAHLLESHQLGKGDYYAKYLTSTKSQISVERSCEILGQSKTEDSETSNRGSAAGPAKKNLPWTEQSTSCRLCGEVGGFSGLVEHLKKYHDKMTKKAYLMTFPDERKRARYWQCKVCDTKHLHTTKCIEDHLKISHSMTARKYDEKFNDECAIVYDNYEEEKR